MMLYKIFPVSLTPSNQLFTSFLVPHRAFHSHTVKEKLPRGRMPIPNHLTVSVAGNPPVHKEARYDTAALQAREGARDSIDTASTVVWESP